MMFSVWTWLVPAAISDFCPVCRENGDHSDAIFWIRAVDGPDFEIQGRCLGCKTNLEKKISIPEWLTAFSAFPPGETMN